MNKFGDFNIEQFLKIVISVLVIVLLVVLAFKLYGIFSQDTEKQQAKEHLENIGEIIDGLDDGEQKEYLLNSPKGWYFLFFSNPNDYPYKPDLETTYKMDFSKDCNQNCICICERKDLTPAVDNIIVVFEYQCSEGFCVSLDEFNLVNDKGENLGNFLSNPIVLHFEKSDEKIKISSVK